MRWVLAEFATPHESIAAARSLRELGHRDLDLHSPYPLEGSEEALGLRPSRIPVAVLVGAVAGGLFAHWGQWFCAASDFPINVGGRPDYAPPAFIPITFELAVLFAALAAFFGVFAVARLPRLHHPVFEAEGFRRALIDRYWLSVAGGAGLDTDTLRLRLRELGATRIETVEEPS
ncbi:MAG TPA: DUF3341 domain-containing protein [Myxococcales bacterium]|nr:DUF3341 domain-containing protein [Myxococcales bacterium]